ncbi:MAG TPA: alpha/beta fold hydrolase [Kofleriaceae bacterium]|nr:alpha/beta fold hydrolase [Kofleriaceae bacterium]
MEPSHVPVNGLDYYCEIHGEGAPLLLLHGGLGSIEMLGPVLPALAAHRQVIAVDLHGHGRTALGTREMSFVDMGDDLAVILDRLGHREVDAMGYSLGAGVALRLALQHPRSVRRLVLVSACPSQDAFYPEVAEAQARVGAGLAEMMKPSPLYQSYARIAPHPEDFPRLLDRLGALIRSPFDWRGDVAKLAAHTLLVFGDSDTYKLDHVVEFYRLLGGGQRDAGWMREHVAKNRLAILPDCTHYDILTSPLLIAAIVPFLDAKPRR